MITKVKIFLLVILLNIFVASLFGIAQIEEQILTAEVENAPDSVLTKLYNDAYLQYRMGDPVKAIQYLKLLSKNYEKNNDIEQKYHYDVIIGQLYQQMNMYNLALEYLLQSSSHFIKSNNYGSLGWLYSDIGNVYYAMNQIKIAEPYYHDGLKAMLKIKDEYGQSVMLNNIALCKMSTGQYKEALEYFEKALKLREKNNLPYHVYHSKFLIAQAHQSVGNVEESLKIFLKIWNDTIPVSESFAENKVLKASAGLALFNIYKNKGNYSLAEQFLEEGIFILEEVGDSYLLYSSLSQKAQFYVSLKRFKEAEEIFERILEKALEHRFNSMAHFVSLNLVKLKFQDNNFSDANKYFMQYSALTDTLMAYNSSENLIKLHAIVQNHIKELENEQLKKIHKNSLMFLVISSSLFLIIVILIIIILVKDKKTLDKIRKLANASSEAIVVHEKGIIIDFNNQFESMLEESKAGILGKNLLATVIEDDKVKVQELLLATERAELEAQLFTSNGNLIDVRITSRPFRYRRKEVRVAVIQDITKINEYINSLIEVQRQLKVLNTTKDRMFSIIGHDLKNPFNAIIGFSNLMKEDWRGMNQDEIDEMLNMINVSAISAHTLLENLLDWARIQTEQIKFSPSSFRLCNTLDEIIILLQSSLKLKQIKIDIACDENIYIYADNRMVATIIRNLLTNAIKFTHIKGRIQILVSETPESTILSIVDNGVGMTKDNLNSIFQMENIHSNDGTNKEKGTGLGLILCKELIEIHKGKILIESELDLGSKFTVVFPRKKTTEL